MLYECTSISKKPEQTTINNLELLKNEQKLCPGLVFRDPYFLDFLGLVDTYFEKDLKTRGNELGFDPSSGDVIVFLGKRLNQIRLLQWDRDGFAMYVKSLNRVEIPG